MFLTNFSEYQLQLKQEYLGHFRASIHIVGYFDILFVLPSGLMLRKQTFIYKNHLEF